MTTFGYTAGRHPVTGWDTVTLFCDVDTPTSATFTPQLGCNLLSFIVSGQEYLVDLDRAGAEPRLLGTPVLYPMPNRVRDGVFSYAGREFRFAPNNGLNFIHGLVREERWQLDAPITGSDTPRRGLRSGPRVHSQSPGDPLYDLFPLRTRCNSPLCSSPPTVLHAAVQRCAMTTPPRACPLVWPFHPLLCRHRGRDEVVLRVPATHRMDAPTCFAHRPPAAADRPRRPSRSPRPCHPCIWDDSLGACARAAGPDRLSGHWPSASRSRPTHSLPMPWSIRGGPALFLCIENHLARLMRTTCTLAA